LFKNKIDTKRFSIGFFHIVYNDYIEYSVIGYLTQGQ